MRAAEACQLSQVIHFQVPANYLQPPRGDAARIDRRTGPTHKDEVIRPGILRTMVQFKQDWEQRLRNRQISVAALFDHAAQQPVAAGLRAADGAVRPSRGEMEMNIAVRVSGRSTARLAVASEMFASGSDREIEGKH